MSISIWLNGLPRGFKAKSVNTGVAATSYFYYLYNNGFEENHPPLNRPSKAKLNLHKPTKKLNISYYPQNQSPLYDQFTKSTLEFLLS